MHQLLAIVSKKFYRAVTDKEAMQILDVVNMYN